MIFAPLQPMLNYWRKWAAMNADINFARIEVENLGGIGWRDGNEARRVHFSGNDALLPDQCHAFLHTIHPVGNLGEIIFTFNIQKTIHPHEFISLTIPTGSRTRRCGSRRQIGKLTVPHVELVIIWLALAEFGILLPSSMLSYSEHVQLKISEPIKHWCGSNLIGKAID